MARILTVVNRVCQTSDPLDTISVLSGIEIGQDGKFFPDAEGQQYVGNPAPRLMKHEIIC